MTDPVSRLLEAITEAERLAKFEDEDFRTHRESWHTRACGYGQGELLEECDCPVPSSVLRRCAADRKLLELHRPVVIPPSGSPGTPYATSGSVGCAVCCDGEPVDDYEPRGWLEHPCDTVKILAEAYGLEVTE